MTTPEQPQLYLVTPPVLDPGPFAQTLARVLDAHDVACVRLDLASHDEDTVTRAADALREITHARDIALVVADHLQLVDRLGLDGVHLSDAARSVRAARKALGPDAIVGSFCATSRHDGMTAGEAGADYVSFGPVRAGGLGDGSVAEADLFQWWSAMIELPVVAEGGLDATSIAQLAPMTDFFALGEEIWSDDDPIAALSALVAAMAG